MKASATKRQPHVLVLASISPSLIYFRGELLKSLRKSGCEVHGGGPEMSDATAEQLAEMGCVPHEITLARTGLSPVKDLLSLWRLYWLIRNLKPDIVLSYTVKPVIYGTLAAWLAGVPKRVALMTGLGFSFVGKEAGISGLIMKTARGLLKTALRKAHLVLCQNPDDLQLLKEMAFIKNQETGVVNGSGVDVAHYQPSPIPQKPVYLMIARLVSEKGIREYIEATEIVRKELPESRFLFAGTMESGPSAVSEEELNGWIESGKIEFLGGLDDVRPAFDQCSVYVLPSYREGTPRTVLEALSMQRPVITTDSPGCREPVIDGENGLLVPIKSVQPLAEAMIQLGKDAKLREEMGKRGRAIAEERYDVHKVNKSILEFLEIGTE